MEISFLGVLFLAVMALAMLLASTSHTEGMSAFIYKHLKWLKITTSNVLTISVVAFKVDGDEPSDHCNLASGNRLKTKIHNL